MQGCPTAQSMQDAADMSACKAASSALASLLESHLASTGGHSRSGSRSAASTAESTAARDAALIDANIARLNARIKSLETDLDNARSELHAAQMRRARLPMPQAQSTQTPRGSAPAAPGKGTPRALAERLDAQIAAAIGGGVANDGHLHDVDTGTLPTLVATCQQCATLHAKAMDRLVEQVEFAQNRVTAAQNLGDPSKADAALAKVADLQQRGAHLRSEAATLEQLMTALEATMHGAESFRGQRAQVMAVKETVWNIYNAAHRVDHPQPQSASASRTL